MDNKNPEDWDVLTLRVKVKDKELFNKVLNKLGVTQRTYLRDKLDEDLRHMLDGYVFKKEESYLSEKFTKKELNKILAVYGK